VGERACAWKYGGCAGLRGDTAVVQYFMTQCWSVADVKLAKPWINNCPEGIW
jgi:hypothetical protein